MKKTLSLLLALALLLAAACIGHADERYVYTSAQYNVGPIDENPPVVQRINEKYGVEFQMVYIEDSSRSQQISLLASSNELPDIIYMPSAIDAQMLYDQGMIGTWTEEFFREHAPRISAMIDTYAPSGWSAVKFDGKMYTVPGIRYVNTIPTCIAWNADWLAKLGVTEIPTSLEEMEKLLYRFAKEDPDGNGVDDTYALSSSTLQMIYGAYGFERSAWLDDGSGNLVYGDVTPAAKDALALLAKWYKDGVLDPEFITGENQGGYWALPHSFINQRIGVSANGSFYHWTDLTALGINTRNQIPTAIAESNKPFQVTYSAPPVGPNGDSGMTRTPALVTRNIFKAELVEDEAKFGRLLEIIDDMMMDVENCKLAACGIEGVSYNMDKIGDMEVIVYTDDYAQASARGAIGADGWFNFNNFCVEYQQLVNAQNTLFANTYMKDWLDKGIETCIAQALPSASLYNTECEKILSEGYIGIITGEKPVDYFDEMVKAWYAAGGQTLTEEANAIYKAQ